MSSAFGKREGGGTWCRISNGKIVRTVTSTTPEAIKIEKLDEDKKPTGVFKYELHDDTLTGRIIGHRVQEDEYKGEKQNKLVVQLVNGSERINVTMREDDRYWRAYLYRLLNVDISREVTFTPYDFESKDDSTKRVQGLNIFQGATKIAPAFTKDSPGGMPEMGSVMYKGKARPDFTLQNNWLNENVLMPVNARIKAEMPNPDDEPPPPDENDMPPIGGNDDDIPY